MLVAFFIGVYKKGMETEPDTTNICYMDEYRKARWTAELKRAREAGGVVVFGAMHDELAQVLPFPVQEGTPDDAA